MKPRWLLALALPLCLVTATGADDKEDRGDLEKGGWKIVAMNQAGKDVPETTVKNIDLTFVFKDGKLMVKGPSGSKEGTYKIDSSKTPREIDLHIEGEKDDANAIYEVDKDKLKIALSKKERPKDFKGGPDVVVFTFERVM
jgi:uncharacterized protein (TIGR03067 family)